MKLPILILISSITISLILYYTSMKKNTHIFSIQGKRTYMEDTYCIYGDNNLKIFGVFDGHGGKEVSFILKELIPSFLKENVFNSNDIQIRKKVEDAFINIESILRKRVISNSVGSTACIFVKYNNKLYSINLGDSRLLLFRTKDNNLLNKSNLIVETQDHKPDKEKRRIEKSRGDVIFDGYSYRVNGNLAIARAFGDFYLKYDKAIDLKDQLVLNQISMSHHTIKIIIIMLLLVQMVYGMF